MKIEENSVRKLYSGKPEEQKAAQKVPMLAKNI